MLLEAILSEGRVNVTIEVSWLQACLPPQFDDGGDLSKSRLFHLSNHNRIHNTPRVKTVSVVSEVHNNNAVAIDELSGAAFRRWGGGETERSGREGK